MSHGGPGRPRPTVPQRVAQGEVVGHDEQAGRALGPDHRPGLVDQREQQLVGAPPPGMADDQPRRDPFAAHAAIGHAVEDELDPDGRRNERAELAR